MTTVHDHGHVEHQLGAFVLNALTPDEELAIVAHLAECDQCARMTESLHAVRRLLDRLDETSVARLMATTTPDRTVINAPSRPPTAPGPTRPPTRRAGRRPRAARIVLAAVVVAMALGIGIGGWLGTRGPVSIRLAGAQTDTQTGVSVSVTVVSAGNGAHVDATVSGLTPGEQYRLYAVGDRGETGLAVTWTAETRRQGVGGEITIPIDRLTAVTLVDQDGSVLVTVHLGRA